MLALPAVCILASVCSALHKMDMTATSKGNVLGKRHVRTMQLKEAIMRAKHSERLLRTDCTSLRHQVPRCPLSVLVCHYSVLHRWELALLVY